MGYGAWSINVLRKAAFYLLFTLIIFSPFVYNPFGADSFRLPKEVFARIFILSILGVFLLEFLQKKGGSLSNRGLCAKRKTSVFPYWLQHGNVRLLVTLPALILLAASLSLISSASLPISLEHIINLALFTSVPYIIFLRFKSLEDMLTLIRGFAVAASLTSIYCVFQYFGKDPFFKPLVIYNKGWLVTSAFIDNPNLVGGYLAAVLPLVLVIFYTSKGRGEKFFFLFFFFLIITVIILTHAKTSLFSMLFSLIFFFLCMKKYVWQKISSPFKTIYVLVLPIVFLFVLYTSSNRDYVRKLLEMKREIAIKTGTRALYWVGAMNMIEDRPVLGHGLGTYKYHYIDYIGFLKRSLGTPFVKKYPVAIEAHNDFLQFGAESGLVGLFLVLALLFFCFFAGFDVLGRRKKGLEHIRSGTYRKQVFLIGALGSVVSLAINALASFPFHIVPSALVGACVLGFCMVGCSREFDDCFVLDSEESAYAVVCCKENPITFFVIKASQLAVVAAVFCLAVLCFRPIIANTYLKTAMMLKDRGELCGGVLALKKAVSLDPGNGKLQYNLGIMRVKLIEYFLNNLFPFSRPRHLNRALRQFELAKRTLKDPYLYFLNAYCLELNGEKDKAYSEYSLALFYNPTEKIAQDRRAKLRLNQK